MSSAVYSPLVNSATGKEVTIAAVEDIQTFCNFPAGQLNSIKSVCLDVVGSGNDQRLQVSQWDQQDWKQKCKQKLTLNSKRLDRVARLICLRVEQLRTAGLIGRITTPNVIETNQLSEEQLIRLEDQLAALYDILGACIVVSPPTNPFLRQCVFRISYPAKAFADGAQVQESLVLYFNSKTKFRALLRQVTEREYGVATLATRANDLRVRIDCFTESTASDGPFLRELAASDRTIRSWVKENPGRMLSIEYSGFNWPNLLQAQGDHSYSRGYDAGYSDGRRR